MPVKYTIVTKDGQRFDCPEAGFLPGEGAYKDSQLNVTIQCAEQLGEGASAVVYSTQISPTISLVRFPKLAVKVFKPGGPGREDLRREADFFQRVNQCAVMTFGYYGGHKFLVMEYYPMERLYDYLLRDSISYLKKLKALKAVFIAVKQAMHQIGVIHGDLKSMNVLIRECAMDRFEVKFVDFGFACNKGDNIFTVEVAKGHYFHPDRNAPRGTELLAQEYHDVYSLLMEVDCYGHRVDIAFLRSLYRDAPRKPTVEAAIDKLEVVIEKEKAKESFLNYLRCSDSAHQAFFAFSSHQDFKSWVAQTWPYFYEGSMSAWLEETRAEAKRESTRALVYWCCDKSNCFRVLGVKLNDASTILPENLACITRYERAGWGRVQSKVRQACLASLKEDWRHDRYKKFRFILMVVGRPCAKALLSLSPIFGDLFKGMNPEEFDKFWGECIDMPDKRALASRLKAQLVEGNVGDVSKGFRMVFAVHPLPAELKWAESTLPNVVMKTWRVPSAGNLYAAQRHNKRSERPSTSVGEDFGSRDDEATARKQKAMHC